MIVGKNYILQSVRNNKAFKPESNALSAILKAYTRPVSGIENYLFKLESFGSEFLFRHVATGYYLSVGPDDNVVRIETGNTGIYQRWQIQGTDQVARIASVWKEGRDQMSLFVDDEGTTITCQPEAFDQNNSVSFNEYVAAPSGLAAPVLSRFFKNYQFITVSGIAEGATVKVYVNDVEHRTSTNITGGTAQMLMGALQIGQRITAEQILNTTVSARSSVEYVQENGKVWRTGYTGNLSYQAFKTVVTGISDPNNVETITGQKGEPLGPVRTSVELAAEDVRLAGFTETQFNTTTIVTPPPPVEGVSSITSEQKGVFDNWMNNNRGSYSGNVQCVLWKTGGEVYRYTSGYKSLDETLGIASLSKWFLGAAAAKAVQDGVLNWNDTLGSKVSIFNSVGKGSPTFKQLMCHMGGWPETSVAYAPGNDGAWENRSGDSLEQCAINIANTVPLSTPGTFFQYSGVGMQLAGRMMEVAYATPIQTIMRNLLNTPLGMTKTTYGQRSPESGPETLNPQLAAGLWSTIDDFGKFMRMLLKKDGTVLSSAFIDFVETDQTEISGGYGLGVWTNNGAGQPYHQGASGCQAWINRTKGVCGLIFTYDSNPAQANPANSSFAELVRNTL